MIQKIELFVFVLSLLYSSKHLFNFVSMLMQDNPTPIVLERIEKILLYLSTSYIVTAIIVFLNR